MIKKIVLCVLFIISLFVLSCGQKADKDTNTSEMESATLFAVGAAKNVRTGAAMLVLHNQERVKNNINDPKDYTGEEAIDLIIESIKILIDKDKK